MKRFLAAGMAVILVAGAALAQERQALLIGNGGYQNASGAQTAVRDVRSVADALRAAGWQVSVATDLDRAAMRETLGSFATGAADAEDILIYYSGHALRSDGRTYLAPVDQAVGSVVDVMLGGVPLDLVLRIAGAASGAGAVFLDGAQLEGFEPTPFVEPGLGSIEAPPGVVVVSAAPPGQAIRRAPDRDSQFARMVAERFLQPGAEVMATARDVGAPIWVTGKPQEALVLAPATEPSPGPAVEGDLELAKEIELAYWRTAERSGTAEDYRAYLERYPNGVFADFARARLDDLQSGQAEQQQADSAYPAEQALELSPSRIRQVQLWLRATGFEPGSVDGVMGPRTREALRSWQRAQGFDATGYLSRESLDRLAAEGEPALAEQRSRETEQRRATEGADDRYWAATGADGTADGYRAYLQRYPQGIHAAEARAGLAGTAGVRVDEPLTEESQQWEEARRADTAGAYRAYLSAYPNGAWRQQAQARLEEIASAGPAEDPRGGLTESEVALRLNARDRQSLEQRLRSLGFEPGPIDGQIDGRTREAIRAYQASRGIQPTGALDRQTVVGIVQDTNQAQQGGLITEGTDVVRALIESLDAPEGTQ